MRVKKHIARILTVALVLGMLGISASAATIVDGSKGHLQASSTSTGSITKDLTIGIDDDTVLLFPKGTEFSVADGIQLGVSSYDGKTFKIVTYLMPGETYKLETPGTIYRMDVQDSSFSSFKTYVMIDDGASSTSTPTAPAQPATPPLSKILRTETRMVTLYGKSVQEVTIYYIPVGGGDFVGGNQPATVLSLTGTHTDTVTGKTVYDLNLGGDFGVYKSINWASDPGTIIEVGNSDDGEGGPAGVCFYVAFEGCTVFSGAGSATPNTSTVSDWAKNEVELARQAGLLTKNTSSDFTHEISRLQFAELAVNLVEVISGEPITPADKSTFTDCTEDAALKAYAAGIVKGTTNTTFSPDGNITREQLAAMLYRSWNYLNYKFGVPIPENGNGLEAFADKDKVSDWAYVPLDTLAAIGVMKGTSSTVLSPQGTCTVEQAILLTYRVYTMIEAQK